MYNSFPRKSCELELYSKERLSKLAINRRGQIQTYNKQKSKTNMFEFKTSFLLKHFIMTYTVQLYR